MPKCVQLLQGSLTDSVTESVPRTLCALCTRSAGQHMRLGMPEIQQKEKGGTKTLIQLQFSA